MKHIIPSALLLFSIFSYGQGFQSEKEARNFSDKLMDYFVAEKFHDGLNMAKPYWPLPAVEIDALANQINQQWPIINQRFGQAISKEYVKEKRIGKSFLQYYFIHKFENHSLYWRFDFYKPDDKWKINQIIFLDNLEALYE